MPRISIISVNFNQPELTEIFIRSVRALYDAGTAELIVVDNGSRPDHTSTWGAGYTDVKFIRSEDNLGFAGGNNLGIKAAKGDYLFLVNNDTEFLPGVLEKLSAILDEHPEVAAVSPKILYFENQDIIQYAGFTTMNFRTGRNKCIGQFQNDRGQFETAGPTGFVHGAAMMIRKEAILKAGLMPENYFLYYEEMDWCESFRRAGYDIWIEPRASIFHKESMSVGKQSPLKEYFMTRNRILFIRRNTNQSSTLPFCLHFALVVSPRNILKYLASGRFDLMRQFVRAIWWNMTHAVNSKELGYNINNI